MPEVTQPGRLAELGGFLLGIKEAGHLRIPTTSECRIRYNQDLEGTVSRMDQPWVPLIVIHSFGTGERLSDPHSIPERQHFWLHFTEEETGSEKQRDLPKVIQRLDLDPGPSEHRRPAPSSRPSPSVPPA